jgi:hypothetical protein
MATAVAAATTPACAAQAASTDLDQGGAIPTLEASCELAPGTYLATATMVDVAGQRSTSTRSFTVFAAKPSIVTRTPGVSATGVARDVRPTVRFDQPVSGVSASSVRLVDVATSAAIAASVTYDAPTRTATLRPSALLGVNRSYRLSVTNAVKAVASGQSLTATNWTFRTTTDGTAPVLVSRSPGNGATGISRATHLVVTFSEPVRGVGATSLQVRDSVTGLYVAGTIRYDSTRTRPYLDVTGTLAPNRLYYASVRSSIRDLAGNPTTPMTWSFRTGS